MRGATDYPECVVRPMLQSFWERRKLLMQVSSAVEWQNSPIFPYLAHLSSSPGWHSRDGVTIHVTKNARSLRKLNTRYKAKDFPFRTAYARFDGPQTGKSEWRISEESAQLGCRNDQALIGATAAVLVSVFRSLSTKEKDELRKHEHVKEHDQT